MIHVVMFDLGRTLVDDQMKPYADVPQALAAIMGMHCADGKSLNTCLVSDWHLADPPLPATPQRIKPLVDGFFDLFEHTGLRELFEPVARRVTLSTHAGTMKPAPAVFQKALARLGSKVPLSECLLVTESPEHVRAARKTLGMQALRFRSDIDKPFDFDHWAQAPALVAHALAPAHAGNLQAAARVHLAGQGMELESLEPEARQGHWLARGQIWHPVPLAARSGLGTVHVGVPVSARLKRGPRGQLQATLQPPSAEDLAEAAQYAQSLAAHGQIGDQPTASHALQEGAGGQRRLVRRGFSAF